MANEILQMELSPEDETLLRESLSTWKEEVYATLMEEVEETQKIEELEEANREYQSELKEEFSKKMIDTLDEMRSEIRAEVLGEMIETNPELQLLEKVKELVAPTLNEEYLGNLYIEEIKTLREENENLRREVEIEEGAEALAELIAPYPEKTQNILLALIKEGNEEEDEEDDEEDDEDDEEDDEEEETDESVDDDNTYIKKGETDEEDSTKKINSLLSDMKELV